MSLFSDRGVWNALGLGLVCAWFALLNGWRPLALLLLAAALHEGGHLLALRAFGVPVEALELSPLGAVLRADRSRLSYSRELAVLGAGPCVNLLCGLLLCWIGRSCPACCAAAGAQLVLGTFNLLPIRPLDGGQALRLLVSWKFGPDAGERVSAAAGGVLSGALAGLLLFLMRSSRGNLWLIPAAAEFFAIALWGLAGGCRRCPSRRVQTR